MMRLICLIIFAASFSNVFAQGYHRKDNPLETILTYQLLLIEDIEYLYSALDAPYDDEKFPEQFEAVLKDAKYYSEELACYFAFHATSICGPPRRSRIFKNLIEVKRAEISKNKRMSLEEFENYFLEMKNVRYEIIENIQAPDALYKHLKSVSSDFRNCHTFARVTDPFYNPGSRAGELKAHRCISSTGISRLEKAYKIAVDFYLRSCDFFQNHLAFKLSPQQRIFRDELMESGFAPE